MSEVRIVCVAHTGSTWLKRAVTQLGVEFTSPTHVREHPTEYFLGDLPVLSSIVDPMRNVLTRLNQNEEPIVHRYRTLARLCHAGAHVIPIDGPEGDRIYEEISLAEFLERPHPPPLDWTPIQTSPDPTGLRARYLAGEMPDELVPWAERLNNMPAVLEMLDWFGYNDLIWR